ncbi:Uncharacterised protein [Nocardia otitidiscaviarum]|uniref:DUF4190 domain-containing protein n=1 Tax=Nocardia otitidiscaviarum TaxID=1823 RepID=A0A378YF79_9NOCA|nr:DUF4190 domain-containing protein [Nocardia otitidiscaviarum]SUA75151.1 Uncharacterised protein [Nocardia otitidiscaviarum]
MTNSGDSDEWWKQYGGEGVTPDSSSSPSVPQPPVAGYSSAPQYQAPPMTPPPQQQYPNYPPPQANPSTPGYPQPTPAPAPGPPYGYQSGGQAQPGYPQGGYAPYGYAPQRSTNGMAIASLVVSILGLTTLFFCFLPIGSLVGLILGVAALNQVKQSQQEGRGLALGGIWVGAAGLALGVLAWIFIGAAVISGS